MIDAFMPKSREDWNFLLAQLFILIGGLIGGLSLFFAVIFLLSGANK